MDTVQLSSTLNLNKICRICLLETENMFSVYSAFFEENESENFPRIYEVLKQISSIEIKPADRFPKLICSKCIDKAHSSYQFQLQCNRSQSFLNEYIAHLSKSTSKRITVNSGYTLSPNGTKTIDKEGFKKNVVNKIHNELLKDQKISKTVVCSNNKHIGNECNNFVNDKSENTFSKEGGINCKTSMMKKPNFAYNNFNDDFNSESESLRGDDILSTEDILKSLDLISNIDNQEDLDLDEDCEDLKSCILLGDETIDQLIKDNLQTDNHDSLLPKMESFNYNLVEKDINNCTDKTSSKYPIDKTYFFNNSTSALHPSKAERNIKFCGDYFKQLVKKQTIFKCIDQKQTCTNIISNESKMSNEFDCSVDMGQSDILQQSISKINIEPIPVKTSLDTIQLASCKNSKNGSFNDCKHNIDLSSLNEPKIELVVIKNSSNNLVGSFESQISSSTNGILHNHVINESSGKIIDFQKPIKQVLSANSTSKPKYELISVEQPSNNNSRFKLVLLPNLISKPKTTPCSMIRVPGKTCENEFTFDRNENKISPNPTFTTSLCRKIIQQKSGCAFDNKEPNASIVIKTLNDKLKTGLTSYNPNTSLIENFTNKLEVGCNNNHPLKLKKLNKKSVVIKHSTMDIKVDSNSPKIPINTLNKVSNNIPFNSGLASLNSCSVEQNKIDTQQNIFSPDNLKIENISFVNSLKERKSSGQVLNESQFNLLPFANKSDDIKVVSIPVKCPTLEHIPFKHPIANSKSMYQSKTYIANKPGDLLLSMQLSGKNPTQQLQSFPKLKTFSIKPREPPNMDYYKIEGENNTVEYACNICPKKFRFAHNLRFHIKNHGLEKPFICTECKKDFKVYGSLIHHSRSHSGEQPYECQVCGKRYKQGGTLTAHMRVHTGQKPFECKVCGKGFRQAPDLTYHMRTHTKEKPYMCTICGKTMSMQCHLVQHMRSHTGEKPFKCLDCGKAFPSSARLKRHTIIHTSLKPFKCKICTKAFNRNSSLQLHMKVHVGLKSHICSYCNRGFFWAHSLRTHITSHLKENGKDKVAPTAGITQGENFESEPTLKTEPLLENTVTDDSFTVLTREDINKLGLGSYQIFTIGCSNYDTDTFTVYQSDSNDDQIRLLDNSTIPLSTVSI